jgi:hypothetical protein
MLAGPFSVDRGYGASMPLEIACFRVLYPVFPITMIFF